MHPAVSSAIALLGRQPWGKWLLVVVAIGLAGYALWGVVRAVFDPLRRGHDAKGWLERGGFLLSAFSYILLLIPTVASILNLRQSASAGGAAVPPAVRQSPWAPWLFGAFGLFWLVNGAAQLLAAYRASFVRDLEVVQLSRMTRKKRTMPLYGMQWGRALYLYPIEESLVEDYPGPPTPAQLTEARMYGGSWRPASGRRWQLIWTEAAAKDFYLNNILIHELGHLLDTRNTRTVERERYAEWFAVEYGYRPTQTARQAKRRELASAAYRE